MNIVDSNQDLFEESRMSFGEHLEELRKALFKASIGLAIGCAIGFFLANPVVKILNEPLIRAMGQFRKSQAKADMVTDKGYVPVDLIPWLEKEQFVPRKLRVDPAELIGLLQTVVPSFGTSIKIDPYGFQTNHFDLEKIPSLCKQLSTPEQRTELQTVLWNAIPAPDQQQIAAIATKTDATPEDLDAVAEIFNQVTHLDSFRQHELFQSMLAVPESSWSDFLNEPVVNPLAEMNQSLVAQPDPNLSRRVNRALIASLFPETMPPLKMNLISLEVWESNLFQPQSLAATDGFGIWLRAALMTGVCLSFPWIFYCLWEFVAAGLYPSEKQYVHMFVPISTALFISGVLLAYFFVFDPVLSFLLSFNAQMGIAPEMRINDWLSFVMMLPLGFGIAFQLPLVMVFLNRINLFTIEAYLSKWRVAVMAIFVLSMVLTPQDPISMLLLAIPLTMLYFLGIIMCRYMPGYSANPFDDSKYVPA